MIGAIRTDISQDSILGFRVHRGTNRSDDVVNEQSNLLGYMFTVFQKFIDHTVNAENHLLNHCIKNEIVINTDQLWHEVASPKSESGENGYQSSMLNEWKQIVSNAKYREKLIAFGMAAARGSFINTSKNPGTPSPPPI